MKKILFLFAILLMMVSCSEQNTTPKTNNIYVNDSVIVHILRNGTPRGLNRLRYVFSKEECLFLGVPEDCNTKLYILTTVGNNNRIKIEVKDLKDFLLNVKQN